MKKIICLMLAIVSLCLILASCGEDILDQAEEAIGEFDLEIEKKEELATVEFYIIGGENSNASANLTVANALDKEFKLDYNTSVNMHYISASEYAQKLKTDLEAYKNSKMNSDAPDKSFVALVNDESLYNELKEMGVIVNLSSLIEANDYKYGTLKKQLGELLPLTYDILPGYTEKYELMYDIDDAYLTGSQAEAKYYIISEENSFERAFINKELAVKYALSAKAEQCTKLDDMEKFLADAKTALEKQIVNDDADKKAAEIDSILKDIVPEGKLITSEGFYAIPNNHVYGEYNYILINKAMAVEYSMVTKAEACKTVEDAEALIAEFKDFYMANCVNNPQEAEAKANEFVKMNLTGYYGDIVEASDEYYCVVTASPEPTKADVYSGAFVVAGSQILAERAMRVVYAINTDTKYRNLLQYGLENINYSKVVEDGITTVHRIGGNSAYSMTLKYTGDIYKAYNCEELCIFCTDGQECDSHIYWTADNNATCTTWVNYNLDGGKWDEGFVPVTGMTNTTVILENYIPVKEGYTFAGWYNTEAYDTLVKEVLSNQGVVEVFAKWEKLPE